MFSDTRGPAALQQHLASPAAGSLSLSGLAPSLTGTTGIAPDAGTLVFSGHVPTLTVSQLAVSAEPGVGTLTLSGLAPGLSIPTLLPTGALLFTGHVPDVVEATPNISAGPGHSSAHIGLHGTRRLTGHMKIL